jgi:hypothetical protein
VLLRRSRGVRLDRRVPSFDEFVALVAPALGVAPEELAPHRRLRVDIPLDELSLSQLVLTIQDMNVHFDLPEQLDLEDVTVADLHHFCTVMGPGHRERGRAAP